MRYWKVEAKCGHVRRSRYIIKTFYVYAEDGREAADIVRWKPRVKHHDKEAIRSVKEITHEEYLVGLKSHYDDPFFRSHSKQEQNAKCIGIDYETYYEDKPIINKKKTNTRRHLIDNQKNAEWERCRRSGIYE